MRSIGDAIREREIQVEKLRGEIEKLREVARMLEDAELKPAMMAATATVAGSVAKRWP